MKGDPSVNINTGFFSAFPVEESKLSTTEIRSTLDDTAVLFGAQPINIIQLETAIEENVDSNTKAETRRLLNKHSQSPNTVFGDHSSNPGPPSTLHNDYEPKRSAASGL